MLIRRRTLGKIAAAGAATSIAAPAIAQNKPLTIGFSMNLTGPLAPNGKAALLASQIWEQDINAKGGLLGRPVKLVYYDDQSQSAPVPGIYTKLLDVDKVDFAVSAYASTQVAPAMPIMIQKKRLFLSLFGTGINDDFNYDKYFSMLPTSKIARACISVISGYVMPSRQPRWPSIGLNSWSSSTRCNRAGSFSFSSATGME